MNEIKDLVVEKKELLPTSTNTKTLYMIVTEDPTVKTKQRTYISTRCDMGVASVSINGFEVASSKIAQIINAKTFKDAIEVANKEYTSESYCIPWHRIIRIKNIVLSVK